MRGGRIYPKPHLVWPTPDSLDPDPLDLRIYRDTAALQGTCYIEIRAGPRPIRYWQEGSIFVDVGAIERAVGLVRRHWPSYDLYGPNDAMPRANALAIANDMRAAAHALALANGPDVWSILSIGHLPYPVPEPPSPKEYAAFLDELAAEIERLCDQSDQVWFDGI